MMWSSSVFTYLLPLCLMCFWSVLCHLQIIYFLFDNFYAFLPLPFTSSFLFVSSTKTLALLFALFWLCHKIPGSDFYFLHFTCVSNTKKKNKYAYLEAKKLTRRITFQKSVYFKVKLLLVHLLLAIALGMTLLKEKKKEFIFLMDFLWPLLRRQNLSDYSLHYRSCIAFIKSVKEGEGWVYFI